MIKSGLTKPTQSVEMVLVYLVVFQTGIPLFYFTQLYLHGTSTWVKTALRNHVFR